MTVEFYGAAARRARGETLLLACLRGGVPAWGALQLSSRVVRPMRALLLGTAQALVLALLPRDAQAALIYVDRCGRARRQRDAPRRSGAALASETCRALRGGSASFAVMLAMASAQQ